MGRYGGDLSIHDLFRTRLAIWSLQEIENSKCLFSCLCDDYVFHRCWGMGCYGDTLSIHYLFRTNWAIWSLRTIEGRACYHALSLNKSIPSLLRDGILRGCSEYLWPIIITKMIFFIMKEGGGAREKRKYMSSCSIVEYFLFHRCWKIKRSR